MHFYSNLEWTLIKYIISILFDNLLPSSRQILYSTLIELLAFICKKLNQVRFYILIIAESFTI